MSNPETMGDLFEPDQTHVPIQLPGWDSGEITEIETIAEPVLSFKKMLPERSCHLCWFKEKAGNPKLSNFLKTYEIDTCSLEDKPLPSELTCDSFMSDA